MREQGTHDLTKQHILNKRNADSDGRRKTEKGHIRNMKTLYYVKLRKNLFPVNFKPIWIYIKSPTWDRPIGTAQLGSPNLDHAVDFKVNSEEKRKSQRHTEYENFLLFFFNSLKEVGVR